MAKNKNINFIHFQTIESTNKWAKENAFFLDPEQISCIVAQEQTGGKGRFTRKWLSPLGYNVYASLFFTLPKNSSFLPNLAQIFSLSCVKVLIEMGFSPKIKWPNDILIEGKKLAGVLCETLSLGEALGIILGIGINVNMPSDLLSQIDQPATSLLQISGHPWPPDSLLKKLVVQFLEDFEILEKKGFVPFKDFYEEILAFKGQEITLNDGQKTIQGICHSITSEGKLNLLLPNGELLSIYVGEIKPHD